MVEASSLYYRDVLQPTLWAKDSQWQRLTPRRSISVPKSVESNSKLRDEFFGSRGNEASTPRGGDGFPGSSPRRPRTRSVSLAQSDSQVTLPGASPRQTRTSQIPRTQSFDAIQGSSSIEHGIATDVRLGLSVGGSKVASANTERFSSNGGGVGGSYRPASPNSVGWGRPLSSVKSSSLSEIAGFGGAYGFDASLSGAESFVTPTKVAPNGAVGLDLRAPQSKGSGAGISPRGAEGTTQRTLDRSESPRWSGPRRKSASACLASASSYYGYDGPPRSPRLNDISHGLWRDLPLYNSSGCLLSSGPTSEEGRRQRRANAHGGDDAFGMSAPGREFHSPGRERRANAKHFLEMMNVSSDFAAAVMPGDHWSPLATRECDGDSWGHSKGSASRTTKGQVEGRDSPLRRSLHAISSPALVRADTSTPPSSNAGDPSSGTKDLVVSPLRRSQYAWKPPEHAFDPGHGGIDELLGRAERRLEEWRAFKRNHQDDLLRMIRERAVLEGRSGETIGASDAIAACADGAREGGADANAGSLTSTVGFSKVIAAGRATGEIAEEAMAYTSTYLANHSPGRRRDVQAASVLSKYGLRPLRPALADAEAAGNALHPIVLPKTLRDIGSTSHRLRSPLSSRSDTPRDWVLCRGTVQKRISYAAAAAAAKSALADTRPLSAPWK